MCSYPVNVTIKLLMNRVPNSGMEKRWACPEYALAWLDKSHCTVTFLQKKKKKCGRSDYCGLFGKEYKLIMCSQSTNNCAEFIKLIV